LSEVKGKNQVERTTVKEGGFSSSEEEGARDKHSPSLSPKRAFWAILRACAFLTGAAGTQNILFGNW